MIGRDSLRQLFRYGLIGLGLNGLGYATYLALTSLGASPFWVVGLLYPVFAYLSFMLNRIWSFDYRGRTISNLLRYVLAHTLGYLLNLAVLYVGVETLRFPHQYVQLAAVFIVAGFLFIQFKWYVYPRQPADGRPRVT